MDERGGGGARRCCRWGREGTRSGGGENERGWRWRWESGSRGHCRCGCRPKQSRGRSRGSKWGGSLLGRIPGIRRRRHLFRGPIPPRRARNTPPFATHAPTAPNARRSRYSIACGMATRGWSRRRWRWWTSARVRSVSGGGGTVVVGGGWFVRGSDGGAASSVAEGDAATATATAGPNRGRCVEECERCHSAAEAAATVATTT
mmetsp:Transcript_987/g.2128  ORF Transcript_987/g.2128 Transcript_987/m.2128 type:complete len:203 (+) Transcript_987:421-1029(+)